MEIATVNRSTRSNGIFREITTGSVLKVLWKSRCPFKSSCQVEIDRNEILSIIYDDQSGMQWYLTHSGFQ